ncbi:MAG TPA: glycosyltransferase family 4 protein [Solirubrobacterales bacterium]|nr:glycosyltransferase family 4 protein [Solirubrobacterales bacterium]
MRPAEDGPPLRVLHVAEAFGGGVLEMIATLAAGGAAAGDEVTVAYGRRPETPVDPRSKIDPAVELVSLGWESRGAAEQARAWRRLRRLVAARRPDVVHLHSSFAGVAGAIALPAAQPTVYTPHGYSFTMADRGPAANLAFRAIERLTARRATVVGAVSEAEAAAAREVAPADRIVVVRNGVPELDDLPLDGPEPPRPEPRRAIVLGRITAQHLPAASARILGGVADVGEIEWVGGGGTDPAELETVTAGGVPVSGWLDRAEVMQRLADATALLHWTGWDGQPLSILEAMAADVVVVGHDIEAVREILGPGQVAAEEAEATAMLRRALTDPEWRRAAIESQRHRRLRYGAARMVTEWRALYRQLSARFEPSVQKSAPAPIQTAERLPRT